MDLRTAAHRGYLRRWLQYLMYFHGAGLVLGLASLVPVLEGFCAAASSVVTILVVVALFRLGKPLPRYRRGAVYMAVAFGFQLVNYFYNVVMLSQVAYIPELALQFGVISGVMTTGSSVCSFVGLYYTYFTHADLCADVEPGLFPRWKGLFWWTLITGVGVTVVTAVCAVFGLSAVAAGATLVYGVASYVYEILRLVWLRRMVRMLKN